MGIYLNCKKGLHVLIQTQTKTLIKGNSIHKHTILINFNNLIIIIVSITDVHIILYEIHFKFKLAYFIKLFKFDRFYQLSTAYST